jgi:hypothetical protein
VVPSQNSFSFLSCIQLEWVNDLQLPLSIPPSLKFKNKYSRTPKKKNTLETMSAPCCGLCAQQIITFHKRQRIGYFWDKLKWERVLEVGTTELELGVLFDG